MGAREEARARERVGKRREGKGNKGERKEKSKGEVKWKGASAKGGRGRRGRSARQEKEGDRRKGRRREGAIGDGYEELRRRSKKSDALTRSRARTIDEIEGTTDGPAKDKKRGRFETERRTTKRRLAGKMKR